MIFIHSGIKTHQYQSGLTPQFAATLSTLQLTCDNTLLTERGRSNNDPEVSQTSCRGNVATVKDFQRRDISALLT